MITHVGKIVIIIGLITLALTAQERPAYTEDLTTFKKDQHKQRLELLVGCWLMSRQYIANTTDAEMLTLVKTCLKHITRKDSVLKITSLIGKNVSATKTYQEVVPASQIPDLLNLYPTIEGEFNNHLLTLLKNYERDLTAVEGGEGQQIRQKIDQEVQKRQKYYFGFIPANQFSQMMVLISVSIAMVLFCTCWKYYHMRKLESESKAKQRQDYFQNKNKSSGFTKGHSHSHSHSQKKKTN